MKQTYYKHKHEQGPWAVVRGQVCRGVLREIGENTQERGRRPEGEESEIHDIDEGQKCPQAVYLRNVACDFADDVAERSYACHEARWPV